MNLISKYIEKYYKKRMKKIEARGFKLKIEEIMENICTNDETIIKCLYDFNADLLEKEDRRLTAIDSKGSNIIGMAGVALALILSLGGLLIEKIQDIYLPFFGNTILLLSILYIIINLFLLLSIIFAVLTVRARSDLKTVSDEDLFTSNIKEGDNYYRRYLIAHFWQIYQNNFVINEIKGAWLKYAHACFAISMFLLFVIAVIIGAYSINRPLDKKLIKEEQSMTQDKNSKDTPVTPTVQPSGGTNKTADVPKVEPTAKPGPGTVITRDALPITIRPSGGRCITENKDHKK